MSTPIRSKPGTTSEFIPVFTSHRGEAETMRAYQAVMDEWTSDYQAHVELTFGEDGGLVDFVSDDRLRADDRGTSFAPQRWSTPILGTVEEDGLVRPGRGEARWHAPEPEGEFAYLEFTIDTIEYTADEHARQKVTTGPAGRRAPTQ